MRSRNLQELWDQKLQSSFRWLESCWNPSGPRRAASLWPVLCLLVSVPLLCSPFCQPVHLPRPFLLLFYYFVFPSLAQPFSSRLAVLRCVSLVLYQGSLDQVLSLLPYTVSRKVLSCSTQADHLEWLLQFPTAVQQPTSKLVASNDFYFFFPIILCAFQAQPCGFSAPCGVGWVNPGVLFCWELSRSWNINQASPSWLASHLGWLSFHSTNITS